MTLNEAQARVDSWIKEFGVRYFDEMTNLALLMEETGELARIMARTYGEQSAKPTEKSSTLADEMADILFVLICLANQTGVDLESSFLENLEKKTMRDQRRHHDNDKLKP
jgi:NTP pyrophosphatase (non-canonical NTP hydrolase)